MGALTFDHPVKSAGNNQTHGILDYWERRAIEQRNALTVNW